MPTDDGLFGRGGGGLLDIVTSEQAQVAAGRATSCGKTCDNGCHGEIVCVRAEHSHDPDADMGLSKARGDVVPHAGFDEAGQLVQWTCLPGDHDGLSDAERTRVWLAAETAAKAEATRALLASVDPALLVSLLREGGHL